MNDHGDTQFQKGLENLFINDKIFSTESESESFAVAVKKDHSNEKAQRLTYDRCQSCAQQSPFEPDYKKQIKNDIDDN